MSMCQNLGKNEPNGLSGAYIVTPTGFSLEGNASLDPAVLQGECSYII